MKTQMKAQKILTLVTLILAALTFVLGLCFCSGIVGEIKTYTSGSFKSYVDPDTRVTVESATNVIGADNLYNYSQQINGTWVVLAIVLILLVAFMYITCTNSRRNYYITNYVAIGLVVVYSVVFAVILFIFCGKAAGYAAEIDTEFWYKLYEDCTSDRYGNKSYLNPRHYSTSYFTIVGGFVLGVLLIACAAAWVLNLIWKIKLMQGEKALLAQGVAVQKEVV